MGLLSWFIGWQHDDDFGLADRDRLRRYIADIEEELGRSTFGIPMGGGAQIFARGNWGPREAAEHLSSQH
jgi:hypothetical protein